MRCIFFRSILVCLEIFVEFCALETKFLLILPKNNFVELSVIFAILRGSLKNARGFEINSKFLILQFKILRCVDQVNFFQLFFRDSVCILRYKTQKIALRY